MADKKKKPRKYKIKLNGKNDVGRPAKYNTNEELIKAINDYFNNGVKTRTIIIGKHPNQTAVEIPVPTLTGMCYYLGFASKQSFFDLQEQPLFSYTIKRARLFIEVEYEEQLSFGNVTGAIFALKNMGWIDRHDIKLDATVKDKRKGELDDLVGGLPDN